MTIRKSGRIRVSSFSVFNTRDKSLADAICAAYSENRTESRLISHKVDGEWEIRLELCQNRERAFTMDEVGWAIGFAVGFHACSEAAPVSARGAIA